MISKFIKFYQKIWYQIYFDINWYHLITIDINWYQNKIFEIFFFAKINVRISMLIHTYLHFMPTTTFNKPCSTVLNGFLNKHESFSHFFLFIHHSFSISTLLKIVTLRYCTLQQSFCMQSYYNNNSSFYIIRLFYV